MEAVINSNEVNSEKSSNEEENDSKNQSLILTVPCPAADPTRPTLPSIEVNTIRQNKTVLTNEIQRLEKELIHGYGKKALKERSGMHANLLSCKKILKELKRIECLRKPR
jgi:phosphoribosylaminoimidazole carboxylase (NCAIR synthetase)